MSTFEASADPTPNHGLLNEQQAAAFLGMSRAALRKWRVQGTLPPERKLAPPYYKVGRAVRYSMDDLRVWLEQHRVCR